jgi:hypothetical protein
MRKYLSVLGIPLTVALFAVVGHMPAVAAGFSPHDVFSLSDRRYIDDRCPEARAFADRAAKGTDDINAADAVAGARNFIKCYQLPNVRPDQDRERYLGISAAASLYLAATKTNGATADKLYHAADDIAAQLGGSTPDRTLVSVKVEGGSGQTTASESQQVTNDTHADQTRGNHTVYQVERNALGGGEKLRYGEIVNALRVDVANKLAADGAPSVSVASPSPKPKI